MKVGRHIDKQTNRFNLERITLVERWVINKVEKFKRK